MNRDRRRADNPAPGRARAVPGDPLGDLERDAKSPRLSKGEVPEKHSHGPVPAWLWVFYAGLILWAVWFMVTGLQPPGTPWG